jgi:hypothetical protein
MKRVFAMSMALYLDLAAGKCFLAQNTKTTVIERTPVSDLILHAQDVQSIFQLQMEFHLG